MAEPSLTYDVTTERWPLKVPFVISRRRTESAEVIVVTLEQDGVVGRGESAGLYYSGETTQSMARQLNEFLEQCDDIPNRQQILKALPAGGARNALDCALWDYEAKAGDTTVFGLAECAPVPVQSAFTLSLDTPQRMANAAKNCDFPVLKLKLGGDHPIDCVAAVHQARPGAQIIVDANEALSLDQLKRVAPKLADLNVRLIEQPLPRNADAALEGYQCPVPLCADESCMTAIDIPRLTTLYDAVNIKLDKCGGLTAALMLADAAFDAGLDLMVGCMLGTSLAMAPAMVIAPRCKFVDLDGPMLLAKDREHGLQSERGLIQPPSPALWG